MTRSSKPQDRLIRVDGALLSDLYFFRVAAASRSFVKAAERLAITQSAVSQRIKRLEARLGYRLFLRSKDGLRLTGKGEVLFGATRTSFDRIDDSLSMIASAEVERPVVVSCAPSLALEWLTPTLVEFSKAHPDIPVSIVAEVDSALPPDTGQAYDVAIRYGPQQPGFGNVIFDCAEQVFPVLAPTTMVMLKNDGRGTVNLFHDTMPWPNPQSQRAEWNHWVSSFGLPFPNVTRDVFFNLVQLCYRAATDSLAIARWLAAISKMAAWCDWRIATRCETCPTT